MKKISVDSPVGRLIIIAFKDSIVYCNWDTLDCKRKEFFIEEIIRKKNLETGINEGDYFNEPEQKVIEKTIKQLQEYFSGQRKNFDLPLQLIGSDFQIKVWETIKNLGYGELLTYKKLAIRVGNPDAVRAVAGACGCNPLAIIVPCHRIIATDGAKGGYTGGLDKKNFLLDLEKRFL